jgi:hypothetical protein
MFLHDEEIDPFSGPCGLDRDQPLTFHWRTHPSAIAALDLPPARSRRHEDARNAVLTAAKLAHERNCWVSYSRRREFYVDRHRYHGDSFRYDPILSTVADGVNADLLEEERARPGSRGRQSRFRATSHLCELLDDGSVRSQLNECIWLRDDDRRLVNYTDTALIRRMRKEVEAINDIMACITFGLNDPDVQKVGSYWITSGTHLLPTAPRVRRVFNRNSFNKGGRLYGWWQNLSPADRAHLLLDGQPVLEPDFAQIHAQIIYALRGISLGGDAYDTGEFPREFGKRAFNIAVNAKNRHGAVAAIAKELKISQRTASKLLAEIEAKHKQVADIFCSDAGVSLMKTDSDITLDAVKQCQARGIAVLPVHDSLIVPASHAAQTAEIMREAFGGRFPEARGCEVCIKRNSIPHNGRLEGLAGGGPEKWAA